MKQTTTLYCLIGFIATALSCSAFLSSCTGSDDSAREALLTPGNPFLPLWEHIPDGEPYVFEDPDQPGHYRVYLYGSHDNLVTEYCGRDQVVWSASVDDLTHWRYDGVIFSVNTNAQGDLLSPDSLADVLYAPDVTMVTAPDGTKTYYLYPNNQAGGRNGMVCRSSRPDGPFEVCNWSPSDPFTTDGVLRFDPAVFVDDDGRVYGYWGFERSYAAELDPATMGTVKPGTEIVEDMVSGRYQEGIFSFFEASSIRKVKDKYVFIYSRFTKDGEFGLPVSNYTLAYAYSDHPLGPWTYGGTIIDARARDVNEQGDTIATAVVDGNTHGSICEIAGQWYVFYHRQTGTDEYARQAMVAPINVSVEEGEGGKVIISEGEYTSEGFSLEGLNPLERHSAGIACWLTGPTTAIHEWPNYRFSGSYVASSYGTADRSPMPLRLPKQLDDPYALPANSNAVVNNTAGSIVGYKYFNFDATRGRSDVELQLTLIPEGIDGTIEIMADRPWASQGGILLGTISLTAAMAHEPTVVSASLPHLGQLSGKHAIFLKFSASPAASAEDTSSPTDQSLCTLESLIFK